MRVIALFGRGNVGKAHCLGHLINLMYQEMFGHGCLIEGQDKSVTFVSIQPLFRCSQK